MKTETCHMGACTCCDNEITKMMEEYKSDPQVVMDKVNDSVHRMRNMEVARKIATEALQERC